MKNFIVSDLHGNGNIYNSIIGYLENINKDEDVTLYINGDLIDRGEDSAYMLLDVKDRILNKKGFNIKYLGGNHELMMYQASLRKRSDIWPRYSEWFHNGGQKTIYPLEEMVSSEEVKKVIEFISKLDIYYKFKEKIDGRRIVLVHARCLREIKDTCDLKIEDNNFKVYNALWTREEDLRPIFKEGLGNRDYFTIIGHTPVSNKKGYEYYPNYNCLNIDGGCAAYVLGNKEYDHTPLVEIDDINNRLNILTFNNNNEIIYGNYFISGNSVKMSNEQIDRKREYLSDNVKIKKLTK